MSAFTNFAFDHALSNPPQRQSPSPVPSQIPVNGAAMASGMNGGPGSLSQPGHHMDLNHLWNMVQQLSEALAEQRSKTAEIVGGVERLQARGLVETSPVSGAVQTNGHHPPLDMAAEIAELRRENARKDELLEKTVTENVEMRQLLDLYEGELTKVVEKLRPYAYQHAQALNAQKAHYTQLLEAERQANLELRLVQQEWQRRLGTVGEWTRKAFSENNEGRLALYRKIAGLKRQNQVLRRLAGWEEELDSEDEEERRRRAELEEVISA